VTNRDGLGSYLRARRELVRPADVGLADGERRRVPGLRREEVALLAGISSDYYMRLEQGRDRHPSPQILDALARVLLLDDDATKHLYSLALPRPRTRVRKPAGRVPAGLAQFVENQTANPALVHNRYMDVLVANSLATALSPWYCKGTNLLRAAFLTDEVRNFYTDWEERARGVVAGLRTLAGPEVDDPYLAELVGEVALRSDEFRRIWARHDVRPRTSGISTLRHPQLGDVTLNFEKLEVMGTQGHVLVMYHAAPGSAGHEALDLLAKLASMAPVESKEIGHESANSRR
jgi:transcriptional regulator with XRE-family HTH domain